MFQKFIKQSIIFLLFVAIIGTPLFYGGFPRIFNFQFAAEQVYPYTFSKELFFQAIVELIFGFWLALAIIDKNFRPKPTPAVKALLAFLAIITLAAFFGVDPRRSFWSTYERGVGVIAIYHLAALGLVLSSLWKEIPWRKLFIASLLTAIVADILAWLQLVIPNLLLVENVGVRPGSTFGNPTFLDGYLIFNIFIGIYLLLDELREAKLRRYAATANKNYNLFSVSFFFLSVILNIATIFRSQTRGDILAVGFGFIVLLILFAFRPPQLRLRFLSGRKIYAVVLLALVVLVLGFWMTRQSALWDNVPGLNRFKNFSLGGEDLLPSLIALKSAWKGFLEKPVLGWGPENFNIVFNKYYDPRALEVNYQETRFDKPHNFILEYLATGGVLLTLAYLAFLAILFWEARRSERLFGDIMLGGLAAYFAANLFVFETIGPLLMLYLIFGYSDGAYRHERESHNPNIRMNANIPDKFAKASGAKAYLAVVSIGAAAVIAYTINFQTFLASYYHYWAFQYMGAGRFSEGADYFRKAIGIWSPYRWNFERDYAAAVAEAYFYNPGRVSQQDAEDAIHAMEDAKDNHPLDAYNHYALIDLYNEISDINPPKYEALAEKEAQISLELSPNRQEVYFSLAKTKTLEKDYAGALNLLKYAIALDPEVADAHFYYGLIAYANGDSATGYDEIEKAIELGRQWRNGNEPRVAANFFADSGHLDEAVGLYEISLKLDPQNPETKIKLGVAYFFAGNKDLAKKYIEEVASKYNLRQSQSFSQLKPILDALGIQY